ncbi:hypothetical protein Glove_109g270 [Diversispora epigaea]|uniref:Uncharacterized protein n=1 Tax=Diversispora epigaea TaxID=1348612 RepID=A0A397J924_9GLOM|nr:hypothetical protein Glove_109g270 [Diversispora epigaea]
MISGKSPRYTDNIEYNLVPTYLLLLVAPRSSNHSDIIVLVSNGFPFRGEEKSQEVTGDPSKEKLPIKMFHTSWHAILLASLPLLILCLSLKKEYTERGNEVRIDEFDLSQISYHEFSSKHL